MHAPPPLSHNAVRVPLRWTAAAFVVVNLLSGRNSTRGFLQLPAHYFISQPRLIIFPLGDSSFHHVLRHVSVLTFFSFPLVYLGLSPSEAL